MVIEEQFDIRRVRHYSDQNLKIRQVETGIVYEDAVDVLPCRYTYEETDDPILLPEGDATAEDYEASLSRLGVEV